MERFSHDGFAKVTVDELAANLGISKKTFYKCFANKEGLVDSIADRMMLFHATNVDRIIRSDLPFPQKLHGLMTYVGRLYGRVNGTLLRDMRRHAPETWVKVSAFRREKIQVNIGRLITEGIEQGHIRKDANPRLFLITFLGAVEAVLNPDVLTVEPFSSEDALRMVLQILFQGILTEDASKSLVSLQQQPPVPQS
jgi:AcrR family transcriptional regulator